jgi:phosphatidylglycerol---prolipoprotein diacylglyceryl transferase
VIFYNIEYFSQHLEEILMIWKGGMSFHGGAIGVIIAIIVFAYRYNYRLYDVSDPLVSILPVALGL